MNKNIITIIKYAIITINIPIYAKINNNEIQQLDNVKVEISADASKGGLTKAYSGGEVANGGKVGILGNKSIIDYPYP